MPGERALNFLCSTGLEEGWYEPLLTRFIDLLSIIRKFYFHPDQMGSYSKRRLIPIVFPETYEGFSISGGMDIHTAQYKYHLGGLPWRERSRLLSQLREYLKRDVLLELRIYQYLLERTLARKRYILSPGPGQQWAANREVESLLKETEAASSP